MLWFAWPAGGFTPFIFIAFVPILWLEDQFSRRATYTKKEFFGWAYISMLVWNTLSTWWVCNASFGGGVFAIAANSMFMALLLWLFHCTHKKFQNYLAYLSLPVYWIAFEYLHLQWELSWPWLTLGNVFATTPSWIQWYENTGVLGGTLWVLSVNCLLAVMITSTKKYRGLRGCVIFLLLLPVALSQWRYFTYTEKINPINIVVTQPNIDPYNEKFSGMSNEEQLIRILQLANLEVTDSTDYVLAPETAIPYSLWEDELEQYHETQLIRKYMESHPGMNILIGASTNKIYSKNEAIPATARPLQNRDGFYDSFNTALHFENNKPIQIFHKSKLVPGVEKMPYPKVFGFLQNLTIDMGGTAGSLGMQKEPSVFTSSKGVVAPVVCYESVYGDYLSHYIRKGAEWIAIITNDGWWGNTPGYRQHQQYARLAAVALRRSIARSANTGISCFINQRGDVLQATPYWQEAVITQSINRNLTMTFYAQHGDYIGRMAAILFFPMLIFVLFKRKK